MVVWMRRVWFLARQAMCIQIAITRYHHPHREHIKHKKIRNAL